MKNLGRLTFIYNHDIDQDGILIRRQCQYNSIIIDLGLILLPSHLTLRYNANAAILSHWSKTIVFPLSKDNFRFIPCETLIHHHLLLHE